MKRKQKTLHWTPLPRSHQPSAAAALGTRVTLPRSQVRVDLPWHRERRARRRTRRRADRAAASVGGAPHRIDPLLRLVEDDLRLDLILLTAEHQHLLGRLVGGALGVKVEVLALEVGALDIAEALAVGEQQAARAARADGLDDGAVHEDGLSGLEEARPVEGADGSDGGLDDEGRRVLQQRHERRQALAQPHLARGKHRLKPHRLILVFEARVDQRDQRRARVVEAQLGVVLVACDQRLVVKEVAEHLAARRAHLGPARLGRALGRLAKD
mmetsp:Transcript_49566/g.137419  ORF Transcript_49566/g.137419 Transcript_49566/m.137419 type:complete len:270 (+) Transcript_49566:274-1083(+)